MYNLQGMYKRLMNVLEAPNGVLKTLIYPCDKVLITYRKLPPRDGDAGGVKMWCVNSTLK